MKTINKQIKKKLLEYFIFKKNIVKFVYLFGSKAKNEETTLSDIDIAVFLDEKINSNMRFDIRLKLINDLSKILHTDSLDLIILNDCPLPLLFNVIRDGIILYEKDELKRLRFEAKIMSLYFDRQYYYERHNKNAITAIAQEGIL